MMDSRDTIVAPATASGGAIAVIRVSGTQALPICDRIFRGNIRLADAPPRTVHYGRIAEAPHPAAFPSSFPDIPDSRTESQAGTPRTASPRTSGPHETTSDTASRGVHSQAAPNHITNCGHENGAPEFNRPISNCETAVPAGERVVDDVLASVFRAPHSYTGEDSVEISCHGSPFIVSEILRLLIAAGARMAQPGEFTSRAFLAGKMDLAQAEAVADLIASSSRTAHALASAQMRGGFSAALQTLRGRLVHLMSMLELELDFSEEDVEFADRAELRETIQRIDLEIESLRTSFSLGNALKQGVSVAIAGAPNVGKSTLLNRLLGEERAMVSEIAGTTRDAIEETVDIDGVLFRFIDTAGIRNTADRLEQMGIERTHAAIARAQIVIRMTHADSLLHQPPTPLCQDQAPDLSDHSDMAERLISYFGNEADDIGSMHEPGAETTSRSGNAAFESEKHPRSRSTEKRTIHVFNKIDKVPNLVLPLGVIGLSAREGTGIERLRRVLREAVDTEALFHGDAVVSSARHFEALTAAHLALVRALNGMDEDLPADLLGEELRCVLYHLGAITGEITNDEILGNIFSKFCIGK